MSGPDLTALEGLLIQQDPPHFPLSLLKLSAPVCQPPFGPLGFKRAFIWPQTNGKVRPTMTTEEGSSESFAALSPKMCLKRQLLPSLHNHLDTQNPTLSSWPICVLPSLRHRVQRKGVTRGEEMTLNLASISPNRASSTVLGRYHMTRNLCWMVEWIN